VRKLTSKKRPNGDGSIFKVGNKWRAVISLGVINGRRVRRSKTARTREEARKFLRELQAKVDASQIDAKDMTIAEWFQLWLSSVVDPNHSESTRYSYRRHVERFLIPAIGHYKLSALAAVHIREMLNSITAPSHRAISYSVLLTGLTQAVQDGLLSANPCDSVKKPPSGRKDIRPFTPEETQKILEETEGNRLHAFYRLALSFGVRQAELCGLEWSAVDFEEGTFTIDKQAVLVQSDIHFRKPKTKAGVRTIRLTPKTEKALQERRAIALKEGHASSKLVFTNTKGGVVSRKSFWTHNWKPLLARLGIEHRGFHHTRHTAATAMLTDGVPVLVVSGILGHATPSITLDIYAHYLPDQQDAATASVTRLLG